MGRYRVWPDELDDDDNREEDERLKHDDDDNNSNNRLFQAFERKCIVSSDVEDEDDTVGNRATKSNFAANLGLGRTSSNPTMERNSMLIYHNLLQGGDSAENNNDDIHSLTRHHRNMDGFHVVFTDNYSSELASNHCQGGRGDRSLKRLLLYYVAPMVILLIALVWKDPPPAPPPMATSSTTSTTASSPVIMILQQQQRKETEIPFPSSSPSSWTAFLSYHGQQLLQSVTVLGIDTPRHILYWLGTSLAADLSLLYERAQQQWLKLKSTKQSSCLWPSPIHSVYWAQQKEQQTMIDGQPVAVAWLMDSVQAWSLRSSHPNVQSSSTSTAAALIVLATGYQHTGKRTLAWNLAAEMNRICGPTTGTPETSPGHSKSILLHLKGNDWKLEAYQEHGDVPSIGGKSAATRLFRKLALTIEAHVVEHHRKHGSSSQGGLILLTNVEEIDSKILSKLLLTISGTAPWKEAFDDWPNLHYLTRNYVIFMTSDTVGVKSITRNLRVSQGDLAAVPVSLNGDLQLAVAEQWGKDVATAISAILPFGPLTPDSLAQVMRRRVSTIDASTRQGRDFFVTNAAVAHFLSDRRVEYIEWSWKQPNQQKKSHSQTQPTSSNDHQGEQEQLHPIDKVKSHSLQIAVYGAKVLQDTGAIMTKIYAQVSQVALSTSTESMNDDAVLVLDYDSRSMLENNRGVLKRCTMKHKVVINYASTNSIDEYLQDCTDIGRFRT